MRMSPHTLARSAAAAQVLHDAFFRFQTKPVLSTMGDIYYEGKEFDVKLKAKTPGATPPHLRMRASSRKGLKQARPE